MAFYRAAVHAAATPPLSEAQRGSPRTRKMRVWEVRQSHRIHVWYIYLHLVDFYGKCRYIYHTWILWEWETLSARWFKVPFWFLSWRSLSLFEGSLNHPKKVTKNCQVGFLTPLENEGMETIIYRSNRYTGLDIYCLQHLGRLTDETTQEWRWMEDYFCPSLSWLIFHFLSDMLHMFLLRMPWEIRALPKGSLTIGFLLISIETF